MNEVFIPKTSFIAYLLLVYYKCRLACQGVALWRRLVVKESYFFVYFVCFVVKK